MIDVTKLTDAAKQFDATKIDLSRFDVTRIDLPKVDLPKVDLPRVGMPDIDVAAGFDRVAGLLRDVAYAGIGVWVIAAQQVDGELRRYAAKIG